MRPEKSTNMQHEYKLPSLGDGVSGKVTDIMVKPGDKVTAEQIVLIVGTDKVDAEMPVDAAGTVTEILVKVGDEVTEGSLVLRIETAAASEPAAAPVAAPASPATETLGSYEFKLPAMGDGVTGKVTEIRVKIGDPVQPEQIVMTVGTDKVDAEIPADMAGIVEAILVNIGDEVGDGASLLRLKTTGAAPAPSAPAVEKAVPAPAPVSAPAPAAPAPAPTPASPGNYRVSPLARKRAKELGVNLSDVRPAPGADRISYKDVVDFVKQKLDNNGGSVAGGAVKAKSLPDFSKFGTVERQPLSRIGVLTAENMTYAFNAIPHAWISEKADITRLEALRQQFKEQVKAAGGNLTTTAIVTKAVCHLLKKMPQFNASFDAERNEVVFKQFYNIGIAVDTPRGLLVPVIRNADQKSLTEISVDLTDISTRTRTGKNKPDDLDGGTFTISNIGGIGGTNMHSIVNWPQVAILSMTAATTEAIWNEAKQTFEPRLMMPMTIGWDHRVINGADAARFLVQLKQLLEEPFLAWL